MKGILKYIGLFLISLPLVMISCDSDDVPDTTANEVVLKGIKLLNAGIDGNVVVEGTVNEDTKQVSFPRIDSLTNLSNLRFEAVMSDNAKLEADVYDFSMEEGESELTKVMKVVNGPRFREYLVKVRLDVALFGAEFTPEDIKIYDYSGRTTIFPEFSAQDGRQIGISSNNIFIASRAQSVLLDIEELKQGNVVRKNLSKIGVAGGLYPINGGSIVDGHVYTANMQASLGGAGQTINIFHWDESAPSAAPTLIASYLSEDIVGVPTGRYEGVLSLNLDKYGNGTIFVHSNANTGASSAIKMTVENFTNVSNPTLIKFDIKDISNWATINEIPWAKGQYLYTGISSPLRLVSDNGEIMATVPESSLSKLNGGYAKAISFNGERYLAVVSGEAGVVRIYDMTKGNSPSEALSRIDFKKDPLFSYSLGGAINAANASVTLDWVADGDEKLYIVAGAPLAGFVLIEFDKRTK